MKPGKIDGIRTRVEVYRGPDKSPVVLKDEIGNTEDADYWVGVNPERSLTYCSDEGDTPGVMLTVWVKLDIKRLSFWQYLWLYITAPKGQKQEVLGC